MTVPGTYGVREDIAVALYTYIRVLGNVESIWLAYL